MAQDLTQAKIDLWDIDDFIVSIEKEAQILKDRYHLRLERIKATSSDIKKYLRTLGMLKGTTNTPELRMILGIYNCDIKSEKIGTIKRNIPCVHYTDKTSCPLDTIYLSSIPKFDHHIIITTDRTIFNKMKTVRHTATIIIICDTEGKVLDSKSYTRLKHRNSSVYFHPKRVLNMTFKGQSFAPDSIEHLQKDLYAEFCNDNNISEFGHTFNELSPSKDRFRDPIDSPANDYYPMNITSAINYIDFTREFSSKCLSKRTSNSKMEAIAQYLGNPHYVGSLSVNSIATGIDRLRREKVIDRYIRSKKNNFMLELEVFNNPSKVDKLIRTLSLNSTPSNMDTLTLNRLYSIARKNSHYFTGSRNIMVEDMDQIQKTWYEKLVRANTHYRLGLEYHQLYGVLNTIPQKVSLLKADVGLGKCIDSSSLIWYNGGMKRIKSILPIPPNEDAYLPISMNVMSFEPTHGIINARSTKWYKSPSHSGYSITTTHGYGTNYSSRHPLWVYKNGTQDWVQVRDIHKYVANGTDIWMPIKIGHEQWDENIDTFITIEVKHRKRKPYPKTIKLNPDLGYAIGLLLGDGTLGKLSGCFTNLFEFSSMDQEIISELKQILDNEFTLLKFKLKSNSKCDYEIICPEMASLLRTLDCAHKSYTKGIPDKIVSAGKAITVACLQGLFDTDGSALNTGYIEYCSASYELASDVFNLLTALGILAVKRFKPNDKAGAWLVSIMYDAKKFYDIVGFRLARKQLRRCILQKHPNLNWQVYPPVIHKIMDRLWKTRNERGVQIPNITGRYGNRTKKSLIPKNLRTRYWIDYYAGRTVPSPQKLREFAKVLRCEDDIELKAIMIDDSIIWEKIKICKAVDNIDLYDIVVPKSHAFISDGIINHNTRVAIANALAREARHTIIVTEPGNVLELEREFKEQLNLGDITKIIKTAGDIRCMNKFNLTSYSTISKVIKQSALKEIPAPVIEIEIPMIQGATIHAKTFAGLDYWGIYRPTEEPKISNTVSSNDELLDTLAIKKNTPEELIKMVGDIRPHRTSESPEVDHTTAIQMMTKIVDTFDADYIKDVENRLDLDSIIADTSKSSFLTIYNMDFSQGVTHHDTPANCCSGDGVIIQISASSMRVLSGIIATSKILPNIKSIVDDMYPRFYTDNQEGIDSFLDAVYDNNKNESNVYLSDRDDKNRYSFNIHKQVLTCIRAIYLRVMKAVVKQAFNNLLYEKAYMVKYLLRDKDSIIDSRIPNKLQAVLCGVSLYQLQAVTRRGVTAAMKIIGISLLRYNNNIETMKHRARYRTKYFASLLSNKANLVVFDECHNLKSIGSTRTVAACQLRAKNYIMMSATPVANTMAELLSYLVIGYGPRSLKHLTDLESRSFDKFRQPARTSKKLYNITLDHDVINYEIDITSARSDFTKKGFPLRRLNSLVDLNMTRISRSDTSVVQHKAWHFDVKEYRTFSIPSEAHMQLYAAQMEIVHEAAENGSYEDSREALRVLTNLIKISEIPHTITEDFENTLTNKQEDILTLAKQQLDAGRNVIVFTQFIDMVNLLATHLSQRVTNNVYMLSDKLTPDQRFKLIDGFRKQEGAACIIGTVNVLGKGFNLANADVIINSDIPWSPLLYAQSIGRILRPDQKGKPEIFLVMNKYMIDMYKFDTIMSKLNMIKKYIDKDSSISESDTHKVDYKEFLLDMLARSIKDGVLSDDLARSSNVSGGI